MAGLAVAAEMPDVCTAYVCVLPEARNTLQSTGQSIKDRTAVS